MEREDFSKIVLGDIGKRVAKLRIIGSCFIVRLQGDSEGEDVVEFFLCEPWQLTRKDEVLASTEMLWSCPDEEVDLYRGEGEKYLTNSKHLLDAELVSIQISENSADLVLTFSDELILQTLDGGHVTWEDDYSEEELDAEAKYAREFPLVWTYANAFERLHVFIKADAIEVKPLTRDLET